jgi:hypothetical protein
MNFEARIKHLRAAREKLPERLSAASRNATLRAVEVATDLTPPTETDLRGANTRSGELKQHWATDSVTEPTIEGDRYTTILANNKAYSSYVNDGHRMDRHFVPGLVINEQSGTLEYNPDGKGGIVVGTKTQYVPGIHMVDKAKKAFQDTLKEELQDLENLLK